LFIDDTTHHHIWVTSSYISQNKQLMLKIYQNFTLCIPLSFTDEKAY
jgi:hypothetical protein